MPRRITLPLAAAVAGRSVPWLAAQIEAGRVDAEHQAGARGATIDLNHLEHILGREITAAALCQALARQEARQDRARALRAGEALPPLGNVGRSSLKALHARQRAAKSQEVGRDACP